MTPRSLSLRTSLLLSTLGSAALAQTPPQTPPQARPPARPPAPPAPRAASTVATGPLLEIRLPGELQVRYVAQTNIPLAVTPGSTTLPDNLAQNQYLETWLRFRPSLRFGERFRVHLQADLARAVVADHPTRGVGLAREPRTDVFPYGALDFRWGYVEWDSPIGLFRLGQQGFTWGLGILANDGDRRPTFGDYRYGDIVERLAFATRPAGRDTDFVVAVAGDLVYRDRIAQLVNGDIALQGVLTAFYQDHRCTRECDRRRVGGLFTYRDVSFDNGSFLRVAVADLVARWTWPTPDRQGTVFAGVELVGIFGSTDAARTVNVSQHDIVQFGGAGELGIERPGKYRLSLEGGYTSGDRNPVDSTQRRMNFNPSHRVGLILFPEVMAWQTARSAHIAGDPDLVARAANGTFLLPTQGGVAGAAYLYPTARLNLSRHIELRAGAVVGVATTDVVDPTTPQLYGTARNYRGGDSSRRDLGLELDLGIDAEFPVTGGVTITGGFQGGVFFPGHAFDDGAGRRMGVLGLGMARAGVAF